MSELRATRVSRQMGIERQVSGGTLGPSAGTSERVGGGGGIFQLKPYVFWARETVHRCGAVFGVETFLGSTT